ncbi:chondroitinase-B domain-containing protein [Candidatus Poribacteria bacterium]
MRFFMFAVAITGFIFIASGVSLASNATEPGAFKIDPPTLKCLGFRWYIDGDDNANASVTVTYRQKGESAWRAALPMLRVNREVANQQFDPYTCGNLFAGSIMYLEPDTEYEVQLNLTDPDGGNAEKSVTVKTRPVPVAPDLDRTLYVYPVGYTGEKQTPSYSSLASAVEELRPGDLVLLNAGVYEIGEEGIKVTESGTAENPIVFRGAGNGESIIEGGGAKMIFDIRNADHLFFEDLTIRNGDHTFRADGASWLTVRRCHIYDVRMGLYSYSENSTNWYIADNTITGRNKNWYPRKEDNPSHTGINFYGRGHVVCYNRISKFWDCLAIANYGIPKESRDLQCVAIDMYNNDLFEAVDDGVESDYGCHNVRIFDNRIFDCHTGLSAQPFYGGPVYFIRNQLYGITSLSLKLHNYCSGLEIYHNTLICARQAFRSFKYWQNGTLRNNLFLGVTRYAVETGSPHPRTTLDYNGYRKTDDPEGRFIKWFDGKEDIRYNDLTEFTRGTGFEEHGVIVDFDIFVKADPPAEGMTYDADFGDLRLRPTSAAIDAGAVLPNVNDDYTGNAPDLGCFESGNPLPHYGPRGE